jgi:polar amino acid transport system substrate-binding protein
VKSTFLALTKLVVLVLILTACGAPAALEAPADQLAEILARGTILMATDVAYPPQSQIVEGAVRPADTKCGHDEHTAAELAGFDIDVNVELAKRLGVEPCFVTPNWEVVIGGNWADRFDIAIESMTITESRMENLWFAQPYKSQPEGFFVHADSSLTDPTQLSGKKVGVCSGTTYEFYLERTLVMPGVDINFLVEDAEIVGYDTDSTALQDLALGDGLRLDGVMTETPLGQHMIANGSPLKQLGGVAYYEYSAPAIDKSHSVDPIPFVNKVTEMIRQMHADGTMANLAAKYYDFDATSGAAEYDWDALGQFK